MNIRMVGWTHHSAPIETREKLSFSPAQTLEALQRWRDEFSPIEAVLLSTCNRVELYAASADEAPPEADRCIEFLVRRRELSSIEAADSVEHRVGIDALRHLFSVAASLDSMVIGEPQILNQVKQAYQAAVSQETAGPTLHAAFQAALQAARRVASETALHQHRVSIPSLAVADCAGQIFERFDDKHTVVLGAGEMAEETLRYLRESGARHITVVNRNIDRAERLAAQCGGRAVGWDQLIEALATADLVVSAVGGEHTLIDAERFARVERARQSGALFILDLGMPRNFDPAIGARPDVFLYSIDDLKAACERNRRQRDRELPAARRIVEEEVERFAAQWRHRAAHPLIARLRSDWQKPKEEELQRLLRKLPPLDAKAEDEIRRSFDRLINKLLHPPLESLRDEAHRGNYPTLLDALARLFRLKD